MVTIISKTSNNILILSFLYLAACSTFDRSGSSGYVNYTGEGQEVSLSQANDSNGGTILNINPAEADGYKAALVRKNLESNIRNQEEKSHYMKYRPHLTDVERIQYLELNDIYAKERWIQNKGFSSAPQRHNRAVASLIEQSDISVGMQKEDVKESWGDPDYVDIAGHPRLENERWRFSVPVTTPEGYQIEERIVYFESGKVVGWESR